MTDSDPDLSELSAAEERRLRALLKHAFAPSEIDAARHERLLLAALEDPFAAPSPEEIVESERLRRALSGEGEGEHLYLILARALSAAHAPSALAPKAVAPLSVTASRKPATKLLYLHFGGVAAALAAAAAVLLLIHPRAQHVSAPELPALVLLQSRSTASLFQAAAVGEPSARIDRIASVRERELRANRYAMWGVR